MQKYDVIILGAGPAGLFAAYKIITQSPKTRVCVVDQGKLIEQRTSKDVMSGVGGSGSFSDGKLHFSPILSHEKMFHLYTPQEYQIYLDQTDAIFSKFGVEAPYFPSDMLQAEALINECYKHSVALLTRKVRHVGSDALTRVIANFQKFLLDAGVKIQTETEIQDIVIENQTCIGVTSKNGELIFAHNILLAPGRVNAKWLQKLCKNNQIPFMYDKIEVGVRVEFPAAIMKKFADVLYEPVFMIRTNTFDDIIRSFCPCPNGYVAIEDYDGFVAVNGHSNASNEAPNSNFAFVSEVHLTEPVENTTAYAYSIAQMASTIGGGKPILQRLADLRSGQRSTWERIKKSYVIPSLTNVTPGDIAMALPHRIVTNIKEGLDKLDLIMPGIASNSTLLYAPEIKLRSSKVTTNKYLETPIHNLYVAGDAAGLSGSITGAAVTGLICAEGILQKL